MNTVLVVGLTATGALLSIVVLVLLWILQTLAGKEAEAVIQVLVSDLLRRAEKRLPPAGQRSRFREETRAGLQRVSKRRPLWALVQAASVFQSSFSGKLGREFEALEARQVEMFEIAKALAHPTRVRILERLGGGWASPNELAGELEESLMLISYHVRMLWRCGMIELTGSRQRRGVTEHFYRRTPKVPPRI